MNIKSKQYLTLIIVLSILLLFLARLQKYAVIHEQNQKLPAEVSFNEIKPISSPAYLPIVGSVSPEPTVVPSTSSSKPRPTPTITLKPIATALLDKSINLAVPFSAQAPHGNWSLPFQEACEETSAIMVNAFFKNRALNSDSVSSEILSLVGWQNSRFGYYFHTTAYETADIMREYYGYKRVEVIENPTHEQIKSNILAGRPVIAPLAGRLLNNPYYSGEGPVFHMLVIKGITERGDYITNDVGTKRGNNFIYKKDILMNALHDVKTGGDTWWGNNPASDILAGPKRVIVVYPN